MRPLHSPYACRTKADPLAVLTYLRANNFEPLARLMELYPELGNDKKVEVLLKLLTFCHPTLRSIEIKEDKEQHDEKVAALLTKVPTQDLLKLVGKTGG